MSPFDDVFNSIFKGAFDYSGNGKTEMLEAMVGMDAVDMDEGPAEDDEFIFDPDADEDE